MSRDVVFPTSRQTFNVVANAGGAGHTHNQVQIRLPSFQPTRTTILANDPLVRLWEMDTNRLTVSRPAGAPGHDPTAELIVHEQNVACQPRSVFCDRAPDRLFEIKNPAKLSRPTYTTLRSLMDNYVRDNAQPESYDNQELAEIDAFLDACFYLDGGRARPRPMLKWVYDHLIGDQSTGGLGFEAKKHPTMGFSSETFGKNQCVDLSSYQAFQESVRNIWFGIYDNHYAGKTIPGCSGFEHIFVGETGTNITGYHYWLKFHWDECGEIRPDSTVNYEGTAYPPSDTDAGIADTTSSTVTNSWTEGDVSKFKRRGGFFVGVSPEWMIASGTLAFFENIAFHNGADLPFDGKDFRETRLNGADFDIATWRNTRTDGSKGMHLRSVWPRYRPTPGRVSIGPVGYEGPPMFVPWAIRTVP